VTGAQGFPQTGGEHAREDAGSGSLVGDEAHEVQVVMEAAGE